MGEHADPQPRGQALARLLDRRDRLLFGSEQHPGLLVQGPADIGEPHSAPDAFEHGGTDLGAELVELLGDRRRRVVQRISGSDHPTDPSDLPQGTQAL